MTQDGFNMVYETSEVGREMVTRLLETINLSDNDREYVRHMIEHIIHNERCDAAVQTKKFMISCP